MTIKGQNNWKLHTLCDKGRTKMLAIYLKKTSAPIHTLSQQARTCMIVEQYVLPSAENINITVTFYADFPFSAENTFLAPRFPELFL
jgi:hypothetical protein